MSSTESHATQAQQAADIRPLASGSAAARAVHHVWSSTGPLTVIATDDTPPADTLAVVTDQLNRRGDFAIVLDALTPDLAEAAFTHLPDERTSVLDSSVVAHMVGGTDVANRAKLGLVPGGHVRTCRSVRTHGRIAVIIAGPTGFWVSANKGSNYGAGPAVGLDEEPLDVILAAVGRTLTSITEQLADAV